MGSLLLPGPTQVPHKVLMAGAAPMVNHRGPEFKKMIDEMTQNVKKVFKTQNDVFTITSSGTGGLETVVANFVNRGDKVLVASIGNFGERFRDIALQYGAEVQFMDFGWGNAADPAQIKAALDADTNHEIKAIFIQHNETSTAVVNPIKEVAEARGNHPALLIVDSVSGMGAADLRMDEWGLDVVVAASQKAFMAPPGIAFVSVNERAWKVAEANTNAKYYFDLLKYKKNLAKGQTPFTPAISTIYAVYESVKMLLEMGIDDVIAEHYFRRDMVRAAIRALGLDLVAPDEIASPAVTAIYAPKGIDPIKLRKLINERYHVVIAGGQGKFQEVAFRIGHLGYVEDLEILGAIAALEMALHELGHKFELGAGVGAAQKAIMSHRIK
ncbi:MAG: alanine--glyoxylate aminotransferase family protein [Clostridia bacterium]|jgi:aspartate aminotransferase-like enzyme|nr:alanine--glyoxylate aminotransferase family protein [Clostridia bacterium]